jgi:hypothetical protein
VEGSYEHDNGPLVSIKCLQILELLSDWQLLKKGSAPWSCESCDYSVLSPLK